MVWRDGRSISYSYWYVNGVAVNRRKKVRALPPPFFFCLMLEKGYRLVDRLIG